MPYENEPRNFEEEARLHNLDDQIDQRLRSRLPPTDRQDALDPQLLRDLQDVSQPRAQRFQSGLDRVWGRLEQRGAVPAQPSQHPVRPVARPDRPVERLRPMERIFRTGQRVTTLVAVALFVILVGGLTLGLILVRHNAGSQTGSPPNQATSGGPQQQETASAAPFTVTSVDLAVTPNTIAGTTCGSAISFSYTATFHMPERTAGGTIQFSYTINNGRSSTNASVTVGAGKTTATSTFTSSGTLAPDHTYPGIAEVMVQTPNAVTSPQVQPTGSCVAGAAFQVTGVDMAVSPASLSGLACGTQTTVTYTATFHIAPGGPGGTIQFQYTVNNGRGSTAANLAVAAGQTTATYQFTWSGQLPADHTAPGNGGVMVSSPNQVTSSMVAPTGSCH